jgi:hypothetical protein
MLHLVFASAQSILITVTLDQVTVEAGIVTGDLIGSTTLYIKA